MLPFKVWNRLRAILFSLFTDSILLLCDLNSCDLHTAGRIKKTVSCLWLHAFTFAVGNKGHRFDVRISGGLLLLSIIFQYTKLVLLFEG